MKLNQADLELYILTFGPHTLKQLCGHFMGTEDREGDRQLEGQIDRTLQKLRRKKLITYTRKGREILWKAVPKPVA